VSAGDAVDVPAGTVHALLAGAVVAEIQQTSDLTYRVYDWDRLGRDGKPRALHIARALDVIDFGPPPPTPVAPQVLGETDATRRELLVRRPAFTTERLILDPGATFQGCCDGSTFEIWGCLAGECSLNWAHGAMSVPAVGFVLLPAALGCYTIAPAGHTTLLRIYV